MSLELVHWQISSWLQRLGDRKQPLHNAIVSSWHRGRVLRVEGVGEGWLERGGGWMHGCTNKRTWRRQSLENMEGLEFFEIWAY